MPVKVMPRLKNLDPGAAFKFFGPTWRPPALRIQCQPEAASAGPRPGSLLVQRVARPSQPESTGSLSLAEKKRHGPVMIRST